MQEIEKIAAHMQVVDKNGKPVGTVDRVEGDSIKFTKDTPEASGEHRFIPTDWVESVDGSVHLKKTLEDVQKVWTLHHVQPAQAADETK